MQTKNNAVKNVCDLLEAQAVTMKRLAEKMSLCIAHCIYEAKEDGESSVLIDIGIGTLGVDIATMTCKFNPSKELKSDIRQAVIEGKDPVELALEDAVSQKLIVLCKDAF